MESENPICNAAQERMQVKGDRTCHDWFFRTKEIPKEQILKAIARK